MSKSADIKNTLLLLISAAMLGFSGCGGGGGSSNAAPPVSTSPPPTPPPPPPPPPPVHEVPGPAPDGPDFHPTGMGWTLVWSDEFDGTALDRTRWAPEESCWGGGNNERQCYTDRPENIEVVNGLLRLIAMQETFTGPEFPPEFNTDTTATRDYTSGKLRTLGLHDWTYGRFAVRMKAPQGQGTWPAFWMLPTQNLYGDWAASGEIDIMEAVNLGAPCSDCPDSTIENRAHGTIHFGGEWPDNRMNGASVEIPVLRMPDDGYHVYAVEWGEGRIQWFINDVLYHRVDTSDWFTSSTLAIGNDNAPFDQPFYLMLNFAVGGTFPENTNLRTFDPAAFPNQMLIDWVRVYACGPDPQTGRACMSEAVPD